MACSAGVARRCRTRGRRATPLAVPDRGPDAASADLVNRARRQPSRGRGARDRRRPRAGGVARPSSPTRRRRRAVALRAATITVDPAVGERGRTSPLRGGFDAEPVLGSRSWDQPVGLGPVPAAGRVSGWPRPRRVADRPGTRPPRANTVDRVGEGPERDWFAPRSPRRPDRRRSGPWPTFQGRERLSGRRRSPGGTDAECRARALVLGAVQVPPDGQPVVMLADHPTTGGYPVIAVVDEADVAASPNARRGQRSASGPIDRTGG